MRFVGCGDAGTISWNLTLLDGGPFVGGAAVAAVHLRRVDPQAGGGAAWFFLGGLFCWLALTAAGPFFYLTRRLAAQPREQSPRVGDRLWLIWGLPWVAAGLVESVRHHDPLVGHQLDPFYVGILGLGLFMATAVAVPLLAMRLLWGEPIDPRPEGDASWTPWVGLLLSATWPIQVGVGLVLIG